MTLFQEQSKALVSGPKEMKIYELSDQEFRVSIFFKGSSRKFKGIQENNSTNKFKENTIKGR